jgi:hypothetical protein
MCAARLLHGGNPSGKVFSFSPLPNYNIISSAPQHCWLFIIAKFRMRRVLTAASLFLATTEWEEERRSA